MSAVGFYMGRNAKVSYHNLYHAVDVLHATSLMMDNMGASALLTEVEQLAVLLSALCHDLDHPGLTNSYQVKELQGSYPPPSELSSDGVACR